MLTNEFSADIFKVKLPAINADWDNNLELPTMCSFRKYPGLFLSGWLGFDSHSVYALQSLVVNFAYLARHIIEQDDDAWQINVTFF